MLSPTRDGFSYTRHWIFAATRRWASSDLLAGTNQPGAAGPRSGDVADGKIGREEILRDREDCPVHPLIADIPASCINLFRFGNQETGPPPVTAPSAGTGAGHRSTGPHNRTKGSRTGWRMAGRLRNKGMGAPRKPRYARALSCRIGLPVSHRAVTGNRPADRNRFQAFGLPTNRPRSRARTTSTAPAPTANQ